jgi:hypothetical protein
MPMQEFSTLIYCIKTFESECDQVEAAEADSDFDTVEANLKGPSEASIKNILNYARSYDVLETESTGYVEMILN